MTVPSWHLAVLIPAHNELELLPRCLASIAAARQRLPSFVTHDVIVAVDDSSDGTYALARHALGPCGAAVPVTARCVGQARRAAAEAALQRYAGQRSHCWLANTDADCIVPEDWLLRHLEHAQRGAAAVAGVVDVDSFAEHDGHVARRFRETYLIRRDGTHPHVHGANLGVRADAYLEAGGWQHAHTAEDHRLWTALGALHSASIVSDARVTVLTSGRRIGRAPGGFAEALAAHNGTGKQMVSS